MGTGNAAGTKLGRYQVVKHLASGGMAEVLLAKASGIEGFTRHVVIKRIRPGQAKDQQFVQMFLNEARLAAQLHHQNIVQVHDIGQEGSEYFFAMEYVHGEDLRHLLAQVTRQKQKVPIEHVVSIITAAATALHHAHEQKGPDRNPLGIVHRDVTPANILVGYDGHVKVVDFGIAKAAVRTHEATQAGALKGKASYMSPEQCTGTKQLDRRSDVFSLGIVLYELLTARRLFKGANDFLTMSAIVGGKVPPARSHRPDLPDGLDAILMKALALTPDQRFQSADEMRDALEQFASSAGLRTSTSALATYMKQVFGERPEPWLDETSNADVELTVDFDGSASGMVQPPAEAVENHAIPETVEAMKSSPIMKARTKLVTGAPPLATVSSRRAVIPAATPASADKSSRVRTITPVPVTPIAATPSRGVVKIPASTQPSAATKAAGPSGKAAATEPRPAAAARAPMPRVVGPAPDPDQDEIATVVASGVPEDIDTAWDASRPTVVTSQADLVAMEKAERAAVVGAPSANGNGAGNGAKATITPNRGPAAAAATTPTGPSKSSTSGSGASAFAAATANSPFASPPTKPSASAAPAAPAATAAGSSRVPSKIATKPGTASTPGAKPGSTPPGGLTAPAAAKAATASPSKPSGSGKLATPAAAPKPTTLGMAAQKAATPAAKPAALPPAKTLGGMPKPAPTTPGSGPSATAAPVPIAPVESGVVKDKSTGAFAATSPVSLAEVADAVARQAADGEPGSAPSDTVTATGDVPTDPAVAPGSAAKPAAGPSDAGPDLAHAKTGPMDATAADETTPRPNDDSVVDVSIVTIADPISGAAMGPDSGPASLPGSERAAGLFGAPPLPTTPLPPGVPALAASSGEPPRSVAALLRNKPAIAGAIGGVVLLVIVIVWAMGGDKQTARTSSSTTPETVPAAERATKPDEPQAPEPAADTTAEPSADTSAAEPSAIEPATDEPSTAESATDEPGAAEPTTEEPVAADTTAEPAAAADTTVATGAPKPAAKPVKRTVTKPAAKKPATKRTFKRKRAVQKPAAKKWDPNVLFPKKK